MKEGRRHLHPNSSHLDSLYICCSRRVYQPVLVCLCLAGDRGGGEGGREKEKERKRETVHGRSLQWDGTVRGGCGRVMCGDPASQHPPSSIP